MVRFTIADAGSLALVTVTANGVDLGSFQTPFELSGQLDVVLLATAATERYSVHALSVHATADTAVFPTYDFVELGTLSNLRWLSGVGLGVRDNAQAGDPVESNRLVQGVASLAAMTQLEYLCLNDNRISDVQAIAAWRI